MPASGRSILEGALRLAGYAMLALSTGLMLGAVPIAAGLSQGTKALMLLSVVVAGGALITVFGAERVSIAAIMVNLPVQLDMYLGWQPEEGLLGALGGMPISLTTFGLVGLVACAFLAGRSLTPWEDWQGKWSRRAWACLKGFIAISALSVLVAPDIELALYKLGYFVQLALLFVYLASALTRHRLRWILDLLLAGLVFEFVVMSLQVAGLNIGRGVRENSAGTAVFQRASGMLDSPNPAAGYLSVIVIIALVTMVWRGKRWQNVLGAVALLAGVAGLALTQSRGGVLALAIGTFCFVVLSTRRRQLKMRYNVTIIAVGAIVAFFTGRELLLRTASNAGEQGRIALLQIAWEMIGSAPLTGVGLDNFVTVLPDFVTPRFAREWLYAVHNTYALITAESGVFALAAFVAFLACLVMGAWSASKRLPRNHAALSLALLAAVVARSVHMFVDVFNGPVSWHVLIVISALVIALHENAESQYRVRTVPGPVSA